MFEHKTEPKKSSKSINKKTLAEMVGVVEAALNHWDEKRTAREIAEEIVRVRFGDHSLYRAYLDAVLAAVDLKTKPVSERILRDARFHELRFGPPPEPDD